MCFFSRRLLKSGQGHKILLCACMSIKRSVFGPFVVVVIVVVVVCESYKAQQLAAMLDKQNGADPSAKLKAQKHTHTHTDTEDHKRALRKGV